MNGSQPKIYDSIDAYVDDLPNDIEDLKERLKHSLRSKDNMERDRDFFEKRFNDALEKIQHK